jgi:calcineurin-like phosphoesterase family protein
MTTFKIYLNTDLHFIKKVEIKERTFSDFKDMALKKTRQIHVHIFL